MFRSLLRLPRLTLRPTLRAAYMLAGDEVGVSKAGKQTYGLGRFYSSIAQRPIAGLSFFALSLVDVRQRRAYPLSVQQRLPATAVQRVTNTAKPLWTLSSHRPHNRAFKLCLVDGWSNVLSLSEDISVV